MQGAGNGSDSPPRVQASLRPPDAAIEAGSGAFLASGPAHSHGARTPRLCAAVQPETDPPPASSPPPLTQIEIYCSMLQRKALTPNDFVSLKDLAVRLRCFERHNEAIAKPFE